MPEVNMPKLSDTMEEGTVLYPTKYKHFAGTPRDFDA